jgi:hypothetical protein
VHEQAVTGRDEQMGNAIIVHCILGVSAVSTIHTYGRGCQRPREGGGHGDKLLEPAGASAIQSRVFSIVHSFVQVAAKSQWSHYREQSG